ncbi:MAG: hypothetical protein H7Y07_06895 [Pyrinomonadaceae bacterium]|nr:hypothetical protein [Sphingobacteriaceae bacterium]
MSGVFKDFIVIREYLQAIFDSYTWRSHCISIDDPDDIGVMFLPYEPNDKVISCIPNAELTIFIGLQQ